MKEYRLRLGAVPFFEPKFATFTAPLHVWEDQKISILALEEVEPVWVSFGAAIHGDGSVIHTSAWDSRKDTRNNGGPAAKFWFTVNIGDISCSKYEKVDSRAILDKIQDVLNDHFKRGEDEFWSC